MPIAWLLKNPLLSGVGILAIIAVSLLGIQTMRLGWTKNKNEALSLRLDQYQAALAHAEETSRRREAAITTDTARTNIRNEELGDRIEEIENDEDAPLPSVISNAISRL